MALLFKPFVSPCEEEDICPHDNHVIEDGLKVCSSCGIQLTDHVTYEVDWRRYGTPNSGDGLTYEKRVEKKGKKSRGIVRDLVSRNFSENVAEIANEFYSKIIENNRESTTSKRRIFRGNNREALMAVCVFYAQKMIQSPMDAKDIRKRFSPGLTQGKFNEGLDIFTEVMPHERCNYVEPHHLVRGILQKLGITEQRHYIEATNLCRALKNSSSLMNRSKPDSIAAAIVYKYLSSSPHMKGKFSLTKSNFATKVGLSDATIDKLVRDANEILEKRGENLKKECGIELLFREMNGSNNE